MIKKRDDDEITQQVLTISKYDCSCIYSFQTFIFDVRWLMEVHNITSLVEPCAKVWLSEITVDLSIN
jgi:hypothetical protein